MFILRLSILVTFLLASMITTVTNASVFYKFDVIAKTGDSPSGGGGSLSALLNTVSINDKGMVAFSGTTPSGGSVFIGDMSTIPLNISFSPPNISRSYRSGLQINNLNEVTALDRISGATLVRIWDGNSPGSFQTIAKGNTALGPSDPNYSLYDFDAVFVTPSLNNNSEVVFPASYSHQAFKFSAPCQDMCLATAGNVFQFNVLPFSGLAFPSRPMITDSGAIVVRAGANPTDPIRLYNNDFSSFTTIADSSKGFTVLGRSPGISDDGRIVVFYGDLSPAGATALQTTSGPGIFARVNQLCVTPGINGILDSALNGDDEKTDVGILSGLNGICETNKTGDDRLHVLVGSSSFSPIQRVAGLINGVLDPGETFIDADFNGKYDAGELDVGLFSSFDPDSRVSANSTGTVVYIASDAFFNKGIYTSQLDFISTNALNLRPFSVDTTPTLVAKKGDAIDGVGTIQDIAIYDPLNNHDRKNTSSNRENIAFWLLTDDNKQAVVRATPLCNGSNYSQPATNPYINQYDAGQTLNLPIDTHSKKGGNACGPSSFTMLINSFKLSNAQNKRLPLFSASDFSSTVKNSVFGRTMRQAYPQPGSWTGTSYDGGDFNFDFPSALIHAQSELAYLDAKVFGQTHPSIPRTVNHLKAFIDDNLSIGTPVLVSTTFSSKIRTSANPYSGGHIIFFAGRTLTGDYIVKDPAGDYLAGASSSNEHYGLDANGKVNSCGAYVVYPKEKVKENIAVRINGALQKYTNSNTLVLADTTTLEDAAPRSALAIPPSVSADPDGFLVIGRFTGSSTRPYQLWIEDSSGRRTGWLSTGEKISDIPDSYTDVDQTLPSDPDESDETLVDAVSWPFMASVNNAENGLQVFVYGNQDTDFSLEVIRYQNGKMTSSVASGTVVAGETKHIDISASSSLVTVPNIVGQNQVSAISALSALGLTANVSTAPSSAVPSGNVISQNPANGAKVTSGSAVDVVVSSGPALITVPNVVGQTQANAVATLSTAGLTVSVTTTSSSTVPSGTVISQNPAGGMTANSGTLITVVVSSGAVSACATNAQVNVTLGGFRLNRATNRYAQQITIKNMTSANISGPLSLVFDSLSSNATLFNFSGSTSCATPVRAYVTVNVGSDNTLSVGETSTIVVEFANPTNKAITYNARVLTGSPL